MSSIIVEIASKLEIEKLSELLTGDPDRTIAFVAADTSSARADCYTIRYEKQIAGFCVVDWAGRRLVSLFIFTPYRRKGIGQIVAFRVLELARLKKIKTISLILAKDATPFWNKIFRDILCTFSFEENIIISLG